MLLLDFFQATQFVQKHIAGYITGATDSDNTDLQCWVT